jgi:hypothetical protein
MRRLCISFETDPFYFSADFPQRVWFRIKGRLGGLWPPMTANAREIRDHRVIAFDDPDELRYWMKFLDASKDEFFEAVSEVGTSAQKVRVYLKAKARANGRD